MKRSQHDKVQACTGFLLCLRWSRWVAAMALPTVMDPGCFFTVFIKLKKCSIASSIVFAGSQTRSRGHEHILSTKWLTIDLTSLKQRKNRWISNERMWAISICLSIYLSNSIYIHLSFGNKLKRPNMPLWGRMLATVALGRKQEGHCLPFNSQACCTIKRME